MVTAQLRVTQPTPHWPEHLPGSIVSAKPEQHQNIKKQKQQAIKLHRLSLTHTCSAPGCCPSTGDLASQQRHSSLAARNISQLPGLHKRWEHRGAFSTLPGSQPPPMGRDSPGCSSCHPHQPHGEGMSQLHLPGSDGRGCQSPFLPGPAAASHHKWVWPAKKQQRNTHSQQKMAQHGSAPQGIDGQGPRETAAAPAK